MEPRVNDSVGVEGAQHFPKNLDFTFEIAFLNVYNGTKL